MLTFADMLPDEKKELKELLSCVDDILFMNILL